MDLNGKVNLPNIFNIKNVVPKVIFLFLLVFKPRAYGLSYVL